MTPPLKSHSQIVHYVWPLKKSILHFGLLLGLVHKKISLGSDNNFFVIQRKLHRIITCASNYYDDNKAGGTDILGAVNKTG